MPALPPIFQHAQGALGRGRGPGTPFRSQSRHDGDPGRGLYLGGGGRREPARGPDLHRRGETGHAAERSRLGGRGDPTNPVGIEAGRVHLSADPDHPAVILRTLRDRQRHRGDDRLPTRPDRLRRLRGRSGPPDHRHQGQPRPEALASHPGRSLHPDPPPRARGLGQHAAPGRRLVRDLAGPGRGSRSCSTRGRSGRRSRTSWSARSSRSWSGRPTRLRGTSITGANGAPTSSTVAPR